MQIIDSLVGILGWVMWYIYVVVRNYGVAIIIFTFIVKIAMFPLTVKQQRSMSATARISAKQKELSKKYKLDRPKYQEEVNKLYAQEGTKPGSGCLVNLIPLPIMLGLYYLVLHPLQDALHLSADVVTNATKTLSQVPGMSSSAAGNTAQIDVLRNFDALSAHLQPVFGADFHRVQNFSHSFNFLGLDLLLTPQTSSWLTLIWLIPLICLLSSVGSQIYMMLTNDSMKTQPSFMKVTMLFLPLLTAWFAFVMPAAVGFYWICNNVTTTVQQFVLNKRFSSHHLSADMEARRVARLEVEEATVPLIPEEERKQIYSGATAEATNKKNPNTSKKKK